MARCTVFLILSWIAIAIGPADIFAQSADEPLPEWVELDPEYTLYVDVPAGRIIIALSKDLAQAHVDQMKILAREGFYEGLPFLRVIGGFIAQAGDPAEHTGDVASLKDVGSAADTLDAQFDEPWSRDLNFAPFRAPDEYREQAGYINGFPAMRSLSEERVWLTGCTGAVGAPRDVDPNSATTGFWVAMQSMRYNDRNHTIFGRVVSGMDHVALMMRASAEHPSTWTLMESVRVAADLPQDQRTRLEIRNTNSAAFQDYLEDLRNPTYAWNARSPRRLSVCDSRNIAARMVE
jgi:peptidylprolyl isomerase